MVTPYASKKRGFPVGWLVAGVVVGCGIYYGWPHVFGHKAPAAQQQGDGTPASVATVISKTVAPWSEFSGRIEAVSAAAIRPQVSGEIVSVHFADGAEVKRGQPLFTIDTRAYEAEVSRAKGAMIAAQSASQNAALDFARSQKLIKSKAISQSEFEQRRSMYAQAQGTMESAKGALSAAEVNLAYAHIVAPISGRISRAEVTAGNLVEAGPNAPLLASIVTLSPIYASFDVDEQTFLATIQGVPANKLKTIPVEVGLGNDQGTPITARIHSFDNQITPGSGTIRVRAIIDNKNERLVPGLFAKVRIARAEPMAAILVNPQAVGTDQDKKFILALDKDNKAEYRQVTLGSMMDGLQIVTSGLHDGDRVVVSGLQRLRPGVPVKPMMVDMVTLKGDAPDAVTPGDAAAKKDEPAKDEVKKDDGAKKDDAPPAEVTKGAPSDAPKKDDAAPASTEKPVEEKTKPAAQAAPATPGQAPTAHAAAKPVKPMHLAALKATN